MILHPNDREISPNEVPQESSDTLSEGSQNFTERSDPKSQDTLSQISHNSLGQKLHDSESYGGD